MRKAAVSIASNIAEGQGRNTTGEFRQFLGTSKGSLYELETQLIVSNKVGYLSEDALNNLLNICDEISRLLNGLLKSLK
jgi:four helix bundle protein